MKKQIVTNTGPLIALAGIDALEILRNLFEEVIVPAAANEEILAGGARYIGLPSYKRAKWFQVREPSQSLDPLLDSVLDRGEGCVIQLARESGTDFVLIDEKKGRKVAREFITSMLLEPPGSLWKQSKKAFSKTFMTSSIG